MSDDKYRGPFAVAPIEPELTEDDYNAMLTSLDRVRKGTKEIKVSVPALRALLRDNLALYFKLRPLYTRTNQ